MTEHRHKERIRNAAKRSPRGGELVSSNIEFDNLICCLLLINWCRHGRVRCDGSTVSRNFFCSGGLLLLHLKTETVKSSSIFEYGVYTCIDSDSNTSKFSHARNGKIGAQGKLHPGVTFLVNRAS